MSPEKISQITKLREQYKIGTGQDLADDMDLVEEAVRKLMDPEDIVQFRDEYLTHLKRSSSAAIRQYAQHHTTSDISLAVSSLEHIIPSQCELWQKTLDIPDFTKVLESPKRPGSLF